MTLIQFSLRFYKLWLKFASLLTKSFRFYWINTTKQKSHIVDLISIDMREKCILWLIKSWNVTNTNKCIYNKINILSSIKNVCMMMEMDSIGLWKLNIVHFVHDGFRYFSPFTIHNFSDSNFNWNLHHISVSKVLYEIPLFRTDFILCNVNIVVVFLKYKGTHLPRCYFSQKWHFIHFFSPLC